MAVVTIRVPNPDMGDVLQSLETIWSEDASFRNPDYSSLTPADKVAACLGEYTRSLVKGYRIREEVKRRRAAEVPIVVPEPDIT